MKGTAMPMRVRRRPKYCIGTDTNRLPMRAHSAGSDATQSTQYHRLSLTFRQTFNLTYSV